MFQDEEKEKKECTKCGTILKLGSDGACKHCNVMLCWNCWEKADHDCPFCHSFEQGANKKEKEK